MTDNSIAQIIELEKDGLTSLEISKHAMKEIKFEAEFSKRLWECMLDLIMGGHDGKEIAALAEIAESRDWDLGY